MISLILQFPFLFLIPCSSAVLTEPPRSRSTSGLGASGLYSSFPLRFVTTPPSALILPSGHHRRAAIIKHPLAKQGLYFTIIQLTCYNAKTKET
jgi:hypothetical protein